MSQDGQTPVSAKAASVEAADVCDADLAFRRETGLTPGAYVRAAVGAAPTK